VISTSAQKLKEDASTIYLGNVVMSPEKVKKIDKDAQKAYTAVLNGTNRAPEYAVIPPYYKFAKDNMPLNDVDYPNKELDVEQPTENEFGIDKQEAYNEPPKAATTKPDAENFGYDNVFMRKGFENKARNAYLNIVNKRSDKKIDKIERKEKEFDKVIKKYKKVVKEDADVKKIFEDTKHLVVSPTTLRSIPGFIKEYGRGTAWVNEDIKPARFNKVFVVVNKSKDMLTDPTSKILVLANENKLSVLDAKGKSVNLNKLGINMTMFDVGTKAITEDACTKEDIEVYAKDGITIKLILSLNALNQYANKNPANKIWAAPTRDAVINNKRMYVILDADTAENDPRSTVFVVSGKAGDLMAFDSKNEKIEDFSRFLRGKGISSEHFKPGLKEAIDDEFEDVESKLKALDYDVAGKKQIVKVKATKTDDHTVVTFICFPGERDDQYLRDLLADAGFANADNAKLVYIEAEDDDSYSVYEFSGL
jgi:hypothetical protein